MDALWQRLEAASEVHKLEVEQLQQKGQDLEQQQTAACLQVSMLLLSSCALLSV